MPFTVPTSEYPSRGFIAAADRGRRSERQREQRQYEYSKLKKGEFRLIVLHPGAWDNPICLSIEHEQIETPREYCALSYVWGDDQTDLQRVYIENRYHLVTQNLWRFLQRLRNSIDENVASGRMKAVCLLWADAISINQADQVEKSQQLGYMTYIYPRAVKVISWLGEDDESTESAINILHELAAGSKDERRRSLMLETLSSVLEEDRQRGLTDMLQFAPDASSAELIHVIYGTRFLSYFAAKQSFDVKPRWLGEFLSNPYFERAWIVQEICTLQQGRATLLCGAYSIEWSTLRLGLETLFELPLSFDQLTLLYPSHALPLSGLLEASYYESSHMTLSSLMSLMAKRRAKFDEDKLFSLLGLAERHGHHYPPADTQLSADEVSLVYTRAIIDTDESLDILGAVDPDAASDSDLPSWALKLDSIKDRNATPFGRSTSSKHRPTGYHATLGLSPMVDPPMIDFDPNLTLRGVHVDVVDRVHDQVLEIILEDLVATLRGLLNWTGTKNRVYAWVPWSSERELYSFDETSGKAETLVGAVLRTLCANSNWIISNSSGQQESQKRAFQRYRGKLCELYEVPSATYLEQAEFTDEQQFVDYVSRHFTLDDWGVTSEHPQTAHHEVVERLVLEDLFDDILHHCEKRLIATKGGRVGLAPEGCKVGDEVCLLMGGSVPFILRHTGVSEMTLERSYELVGEAYIHGIMEGQAMIPFMEIQAAIGAEEAQRNLTRYTLV